MHARLLPAESFRRMRWINGAGWTREIVRAPARAERFDWRASIAEINDDAAFSPFPGCLRHQTLLRGNGVRLHIDAAETLLGPPHDQHQYSGAADVRATLMDGPVHAFNLIWRPEAVAVRSMHRPLVGTTLFFSEPGVQWLIYLIDGRARLQQDDGELQLEAGDALRLYPGFPDAADSQRLALHGGGEALMFRIRREARRS